MHAPNKSCKIFEANTDKTERIIDKPTIKVNQHPSLNN